MPIFHIDAYRLSGAAELADLGFDEMIDDTRISGGSGAIFVEWANRVTEVLPEDALCIDIDSNGDTLREFSIQATGESSNEVLTTWMGILPEVAGLKLQT